MKTRIQPQDIEDRNVSPQGLVIATDGGGNFDLLGKVTGTLVLYDESALLGSVDALRLIGTGVTTVISGSTGFANIPGGGGPGGGGEIGVYVVDDGVPIGTGSWLNFGDGLSASISGTTVQVDATSQISIYDEGSSLGDFSELRFIGDGVTAGSSGTYAAVTIPPATVYRVRARRTSTNNFVNNYTIAWQTTDWNDLDMWTGTSATRLTMPLDGVVEVHCTAGFNAAGGSGRWWFAIYHNGSNKFYHSDHVSDWNSSPHASVGGSYEVQSGDYFQVILNNSSGSGKNSSTSCNITLLLFPD